MAIPVEAAAAEVEREKEMESTKKEEMAPWEQHSTVISIPRFDYNAPSSLLQRSHSGFLITCPISLSLSSSSFKFNKEPTILIESLFLCVSAVINFDQRGRKAPQKKQFPSLQSCSSEDNTSSKRRKLSKEDIDSECCNGGGESKDAATANSEDARDDLQERTPRLSPAKVDAEGDANPLLSLVKLTKSGLLLFTFRRNTSPDVVDTVSKIIQAVESKSVGSPLWCNRIFPIQATCSLKEKELHEVVSRLVLQFVNDNQKLVRPIKFAIAYNRRGIETELNIPKESSNAIDMLDRDKCFAAVATAVKGVLSDSVVDLKSPELCVLLELLPLSGVPKESLVVAVSVLPRYIVNAKPKLCIKALVSDTKTKGKKQ